MKGVILIAQWENFPIVSLIIILITCKLQNKKRLIPEISIWQLCSQSLKNVLTLLYFRISSMTILLCFNVHVYHESYQYLKLKERVIILFYLKYTFSQYSLFYSRKCRIWAIKFKLLNSTIANISKIKIIMMIEWKTYWIN